MSQPIIEVENLSKRYRLGVIGATSLRETASHLWRNLRTGSAGPNEGEFWALRNVSFSVQRGDVVGIIGRNGAGKSTLLKILSRITEPTSGRARLRGRTASLLEVGTGFHPELTGRENIFLNGAILGMSRAEVKRKFDEIVAFSEVEQFIDTPVKRYSSGMYVRLAFAVAAHLEPDILICDEVLAVGDTQFQQKCMGKMKSVAAQEGRTVLLVSHNLSAVSSLCTMGICLANGRVAVAGHVRDAVACYRHDRPPVVEWRGEAGDDSVHLRRTWVTGATATDGFDTASALQIGIELEILRPVQGLVVGFNLLSGNGQLLAHVLYDDREVSTAPVIERCVLRKTFRVPANTLAKGIYHIEFDVGIWGRKRIIVNEGYLTFALERFRGLGLRFPEPDVPTATSLFRPDWHEHVETRPLPPEEARP